jgi:hypothetical protein
MALTSIKVLQPYFSPQGLINAGETIGVSAAVATAMVAAGTAVLVNDGTPTTSPFRGILASETQDQYATAGGTLGDQQISAAVEGFLGGADVTIVDGHAQPVSEPWA